MTLVPCMETTHCYIFSYLLFMWKCFTHIKLCLFQKRLPSRLYTSGNKFYLTLCFTIFQSCHFSPLHQNTHNWLPFTQCYPINHSQTWYYYIVTHNKIILIYMISIWLSKIKFWRGGGMSSDWLATQNIMPAAKIKMYQ